MSLENLPSGHPTVPTPLFITLYPLLLTHSLMASFGGMVLGSGHQD